MFHSLIYLEKTQYMPKILHLKKEFLYYYDYLPNDWISSS